jgi:hypothetical protein
MEVVAVQDDVGKRSDDAWQCAAESVTAARPIASAQEPTMAQLAQAVALILVLPIGAGPQIASAERAKDPRVADLASLRVGLGLGSPALASRTRLRVRRAARQ